MIAVITGASSGIGRATAFEFARRGYDLVLAARFGAGLEEVAQECNSLGGRALAIPTDVAKEEDINALAAQARESFGGFDVWVNNAAVGLFGHFEEIPTQDIRQLMEINLFGYIYGARAAIRQFRSQGYGTLINVSSMVALVGQPFSIPYTTSKFAIRGMSISLSQELADEEDIHVCCVMPAVIDTPIFQHAGNYMGHAVKAPKPVIPAKRVARTIYRLTKKPQEQVTVGNMSRMMRFQRLVSPAQLFDKYMQKMISSQHFKRKPSRPYQGNLYEPLTNWNKVNGGWLPEDSSKKKGTTIAAVAGLALAGALGAVYYSRLKNHPRPATPSSARTWPPAHPEPSLQPDPISGTHRGSTLERQQNNTAGLHGTTIIAHGSTPGTAAGPTSGITGSTSTGTTGNPTSGSTGTPNSGVTGTHTGGLGGETKGLGA
ncbi:SDR family NAD(P)-dependent oxidoreductase [Rufibacter sp. H-1]|uniref:SDR family NAD(P)-dependent oxidoreductase n=1 Tax=Rufibacter sediminis TaxID=2762756 RepID=A0ABR6VNJ2_9BACT|nr:SDR family NAD(P)-dependent oxidoreductase [Rufibacter sediminis]